MFVVIFPSFPFYLFPVFNERQHANAFPSPFINVHPSLALSYIPP